MAHNSTRFVPNRPQFNKPEQIIGFLFKSLQHSLRHAVDESLRNQGLELSFAHVACLFGLRFEPGSTGAQLARRAMVSPQTMNSVLRRLETDGLIERRPHPESRRADSWFLTDKGGKQFHRARNAAESVFSRMLSALEPDEIERLQDYLGRCLVALGDSPPAAALEPARAKPRTADAADRR
jgi:DNA-binding MarR family transcriptional regulator